jgi:CRISPR-associated endonuclease Csn1
MLRMRLWEELGENIADRKCVYTGEQIGIRRLFSADVEIEHILPFALTLDDSPVNLTVSLRRANRDKSNRIPFDAFGTSPVISGHAYDWDAIALRATALPRSKQWRFRSDAMDLTRDRLLREEARLKGSLPKDVLADIEKTGGFLARQLVDTAYLARVARQYLTSVVPAEQDADGTVRSNVWVVPGGMTGMLRRLWGLNRFLWGNRPDGQDNGQNEWRGKLRTDHRHHAVDGFVLTLIDRSLLSEIQYRSGQSGHRTIDDMPDPIDWPDFRADLKVRFDRIVISYKPERGASGRLHEENAYGIVGNPETEDEATLTRRKPFVDLNATEIPRIRDIALRKRLISVVQGTLLDIEKCKGNRRLRIPGDRKKLREAESKLRASLEEFASRDTQYARIRRVRLLKVENSFIPIRNRSNGVVYKALIPGENHAVDIVELENGEWIGEGITLFDANQPEFVPKWVRTHGGGRLVMRVCKGDMLRFDHRGAEQFFRVVKLSPANRRFVVAGHLEAGNLDRRDRDDADPFAWVTLGFDKLKAWRARKVSIDLLGRVSDPGPSS